MIRSLARIGMSIHIALWNVAAMGQQVDSRYGYRIELQLNGPGPSHRVELPGDIYRGVTRADLADMRLVNGAGEMVPFALTSGGAKSPVPETRERLPHFPMYKDAGGTPRNIDMQVRQDANGTLIALRSSGNSSKTPGERRSDTMLVDASRLENRKVSALKLTWKALESISGSVAVAAGDDLRTWRPIVERVPLMELNFAGHQLRRDTIEFAGPLHAKYYRLRFDSLKFEISSVEASLRGNAPELPRRTVAAVGRESAKHEYQFDLGGVFAVDRIAVQLPQINTLVPVEFFARGEEKESWRPLGRSVMYRLASTSEGGAEVRSQPFPVNAPDARRLMMRVDSRSGGVGEGDVSIEASYAPQYAIFVPRGAAPFAIEFGQRGRPGERDRRTPAALAMKTLLPDYQEGDEWKLPEARAGKVAVLDPAAVESSVLTDIDPKKAALWAVLLIAVLVLGFMAWRLSRKRGDAA